MQYAFIDSGIGGLPYLRHLKELEPSASCAYIADIKHFPYGKKTLAEVIEYSESLVKKIIDKINPEVIVIACNTISVSALAHLRESFSVPFVGTVPAIKPASELTEENRIAILATERTINDIYTQNLMHEYGRNCEFFMRPDSELIQNIEEKLLNASEKERIKMIQDAVNYFKEKEVDTAVLACTHFLHLQKEFKKECEPEIKIADSLDGVARQAIRIMHSKKKKSFDEKNLEKSKDKLYITEKIDYEKYLAYAKEFNLELQIGI